LRNEIEIDRSAVTELKGKRRPAHKRKSLELRQRCQFSQ